MNHACYGSICVVWARPLPDIISMLFLLLAVSLEFRFSFSNAAHTHTIQFQTAIRTLPAVDWLSQTFAPNLVQASGITSNEHCSKMCHQHRIERTCWKWKFRWGNASETGFRFLSCGLRLLRGREKCPFSLSCAASPVSIQEHEMVDRLTNFNGSLDKTNTQFCTRKQFIKIGYCVASAVNVTHHQRATENEFEDLSSEKVHQ